MAQFGRRFPHLVVSGVFERERYRRPPRGFASRELPVHSAARHAAYLLTKLDEAKASLPAPPARGAVALPGRSGIYLEFESERGFDQFLERVDRKWVKLLNVRRSTDDVTMALVHVEAGKLHVLETMLREYGEMVTSKGKPRHRPFFDTVRDLRAAALRSFWTDAADQFPDDTQAIWWEVWLRGEARPVFKRLPEVGTSIDVDTADSERFPEVGTPVDVETADEVLEFRDWSVLKQFREVATSVGLETSDEFLQFPDRVVTSVFGQAQQLMESIELLDTVAELRRLKQSPEFYASEKGADAIQWVENLVQRSDAPPEDIAICLLDTGVNHGHPLIAPFVEASDFQAARDEWGPNDVLDHGTQMAGLALYGDLASALGSMDSVGIPAALESVKILPNRGENDARLYGAITGDAVHKAEIRAPHRRRVVSMAVTADSGRDEGRPSSWSAAVDQLTCGLRDEPPRLFVLSAGNMRDRGAWISHPAHLATESVQDPAQAWNALTVGAMTDRWTIDDPTFAGWQALAEPGDLSPSTSTSAAWNRQWPLKPDIVVEGGNAALSPDGVLVDTPDSLRLLTTHYQPTERLFTTTGDTSAACTLTARIAAQVSATYPDLWPETIRGLLVHSAEWTGPMIKKYGPPGQSRGQTQNLLRHCGHGVPDLDAALRNARNELTLIAQETLQPFVKENNVVKTNDIHIYSLPWPKQQLRDLGEADVELRVTLSYFVEPHPGERGWKYRHRYQSHGFRFEVRTPHESVNQFRARVNDLSRKADADILAGDPERWTLGPDLRHKGSIHADRWNGSAAELAERWNIAIFPVTGWWKEYTSLRRWNCSARYSLIISIRVPSVDVDIYTPVAAQVGVPIEIET